MNHAKGEPFDRLDKAGATSLQAMQARIRAFAHDRGLPPEEIHKLMYKRVTTGNVLDFCQKHNVNYDWLLYGNLQGLKLMATGKQARPRPPETFRDKLKYLTADQWRFIETLVDTLLEQQNSKPPA